MSKIKKMECFESISNNCPLTFKAQASKIEKLLQICISNLKDLTINYDQLQAENENYKSQLETLRVECESDACTSAKTYKNVIDAKDNIIQKVASALTTLNETKNFNIPNDIFKLLFGEIRTKTPPKELENKLIIDQEILGSPKPVIDNEILGSPSLLTPNKNDLEMGIEIDKSVSEIESTPGRTSPVIHSKSLRMHNANSPARDKKKCPTTWETPEKKIIKLINPLQKKGTNKGSGRSRQTRFSIVRDKKKDVVDLTLSPECVQKSLQKCPPKVVVKPEPLNDETFLPSPSAFSFIPSGIVLKYNSLNTKTVQSPSKFKKPIPINSDDSPTEHKVNDTCNKDIRQMEESIKIFNKSQRIPKTDIVQSPVKQTAVKQEPLDDVTDSEADDSLSLLRRDKLEPNNSIKQEYNFEPKKPSLSPDKQPLAENMNVNNVDNDTMLHSSISLLRPKMKLNAKVVEEECIRKQIKMETDSQNGSTKENAEELILPGWNCTKCLNFYGQLYKNDPEMLLKKMQFCHMNHHKNPCRPKTPPNYWNPRWKVPDNTEEFNKMNNVQ